MKITINKIFKHSLILLLMIGLILGLDPLKEAEAASQDKKILVFIIDEVDLEDIISVPTPNIDYLIDKGAVGLMNSRAKSSLSNKGSAYLSLNMGVRTLASTKGNLALESEENYSLVDYRSINSQAKATDLYKIYTGKTPPKSEVLNLAIEDLKRTSLDVTPNNQLGALGKIARENNLSIGVLGNSDLTSESREFSLIAIDEKGSIPYGKIDSSLLEPSESLGLKFNKEKLNSEMDRLLDLSDILFINYGDTIRVQRSDRLLSDSLRKEEKLKTIGEADEFLGEVIKKLDMDKSLVMVISPNVSKNMSSKGNFGLTPIIVKSPGLNQSLLSSSTTNRPGIVTNFDFAPTILNFFDIPYKSEFIGEKMTSLDNENPVNHILNTQNQSIYLRKFRKVFHWGYIIAILLSILGNFLPIFIDNKKIPKKAFKLLGLTVFSIPIFMLTLPIFGYQSIIFDMAYVFLGSIVTSYLIYKATKSAIKTFGILSLISGGLIILDGFLWNRLMIISPLGSDAIAGGRFYGIGNDYMGILLGATILGYFSFFEIFKISNKKMLTLITSPLILVIIALSPMFGANMGGTLSAISILVISYIIIGEKKFSLRKILGILFGLAIIIIIIAGLDYSFNPNPTHAGKAIGALLTGGYSKLLEIISIKLRQVFWNLFHASWNIILFLQLILLSILVAFKKESLGWLKTNYKNLYKGFLIILLGSIFVFMFNDTGTIAAAIILSFVLVPMGVLLNSKVA